MCKLNTSRATRATQRNLVLKKKERKKQTNKQKEKSKLQHMFIFGLFFIFLLWFDLSRRNEWLWCDLRLQVDCPMLRKT
ncbi:mCG148497 [Mus musculus]|nr:mCG148497 [Mus musculus]